MPDKIDYRKSQTEIYRPGAKKVDFPTILSMQFLMIDGIGDPNTEPQYAAAVQALYAASYTLKFLIKKGPTAQDYAVMPLEGLWWADDMESFSNLRDKDKWRWTMMIRQPDFISQADIDAALMACGKKKDPVDVSGLRFETFAEGPCAQILHIGPFETEGPTIARLHAEIAAQGKTLRGTHHEIYLSDIRRAAPEKWRTILRQPISP